LVFGETGLFVARKKCDREGKNAREKPAEGHLRGRSFVCSKMAESMTDLPKNGS
jgi:hypothetical protein